jgi:hypothetical protein
VCAAVAPAVASAANPVFEHRGGPVVDRQVGARAGTTTFEVLRGLAEVSCRSGAAEGQLAAKSPQRTIAGLRFAFTHCTATNNVTGKTCPVHSPKAQASDEIVTSALQGSLVQVSTLESPTGAGLALAPKSVHAAFLTFQTPKGATCIPSPSKGATTVRVSGGAIAAVGRVNVEATTQPVYLEIEKGQYGETSQAIQHALGAPQLVLSSFGGIESPISSQIVLSFGEAVAISTLSGAAAHRSRSSPGGGGPNPPPPGVCTHSRCPACSVPVALPASASPSSRSRPRAPASPPAAPRGAWRRRSAISE